jgi:hypothetical protein
MKILTAILFVSFILTLLFSPPSFAKECVTDMDCDVFVNEKCILSPNDRGGVCGKVALPHKQVLTPGLNAPPPSPSSPSKGRRFCMTSKDCESGESCVRKENAVTGVCARQ